MDLDDTVSHAKVPDAEIAVTADIQSGEDEVGCCCRCRKRALHPALLAP